MKFIKLTLTDRKVVYINMGCIEAFYREKDCTSLYPNIDVNSIEEARPVYTVLETPEFIMNEMQG